MHKAARHVRANQSATTQASRQSWRDLSAARCVLKTNEEIEVCPAKKNTGTTLQAAGDARMICLYFLSISVRYNTIHSFSYSVHACMIDARGVRVGFLEHGALGVCKSSVCTYNYVPLSASFIRIVLMCYSFPCDRNVAGGSRPRSEAPYITEEKNCLPYPVPVSPLVGTNYYIS